MAGAVMVRDLVVSEPLSVLAGIGSADDLLCLSGFIFQRTAPLRPCSTWYRTVCAGAFLVTE